MREWVELFEELIYILPFVRRTRGAYYVPEGFNTLAKTYTQGYNYFACLYQCVATDYKLELKFLNKKTSQTSL